MASGVWADGGRDSLGLRALGCDFGRFQLEGIDDRSLCLLVDRFRWNFTGLSRLLDFSQSISGAADVMARGIWLFFVSIALPICRIPGLQATRHHAWQCSTLAFVFGHCCYVFCRDRSRTCCSQSVPLRSATLLAAGWQIRSACC